MTLFFALCVALYKIVVFLQYIVYTVDEDKGVSYSNISPLAQSSKRISGI